ASSFAASSYRESRTTVSLTRLLPQELENRTPHDAADGRGSRLRCLVEPRPQRGRDPDVQCRLPLVVGHFLTLLRLYASCHAGNNTSGYTCTVTHAFAACSIRPLRQFLTCNIVP